MSETPAAVESSAVVTLETPPQMASLATPGAPVAQRYTNEIYVLS